MQKINFFFIILLLPCLSGCGGAKFDPSLIAEPPPIEDAIVDKAREYCNTPHYYILGAKNPNWCFWWQSYPYDSTNSSYIDCSTCMLGYICIYHAFDCSGLTSWVYKNNAKKNIDIAESAAAQYDCKDSNGKVSSKCSQYLTSERKKGDLIFMYYGDSTVYCDSCFHVGIYVGKDQTVYWKYPGNYFVEKNFLLIPNIYNKIKKILKEWTECTYDYDGNLIDCTTRFVSDYEYVGETIINAGKSLDRYNTLEAPYPNGSVQEVPYDYLLGSNTNPKQCTGILCFELRYNNKAIARPGF